MWEWVRVGGRVGGWVGEKPYIYELVMEPETQHVPISFRPNVDEDGFL